MTTSRGTANVLVTIRCAIALSAVLIAVAPLGAQEPARALSLEHVIRQALRTNTGIQVGALEIEASEGRRTAAGAVFDPILGTSLTGSQDQQFLTAADGSLTGDALASNTASYEVRMQKTLSWGAVLEPSLSVHSSTLRNQPVLPSNQAAVSLGLQVPLLRDRGGRETSASERASRAYYQADALTQRVTIASSVLETVAAYWSYAAAQERLDVYRSSEQRAERLLEETRVLVKAEERPASDLNQVMANLYSKRLSRINAEQAVLEGRRRLGLAMGLDASDIASLPSATDALPSAKTFAPDAAAAQALIQSALARRPEIVVRREQVHAASILLDAADNARRPRLDLALSVGYQGLESSGGFDRFIAPLYRNVPGAIASMKLQYQFSMTNAQARGEAAQRSAAYEQARLREAEIVRQIRSNVLVATEALQRNSIAREEARQAAQLYRATIDAEKRKNQLGMGTLFDVILAEDNLTNALLGDVGARVNYAVAIANLRYETGTLVRDVDGQPVVATQGLLSPP